MTGPATAQTVDEELEILGQQPGLNIYTQICLCFSVTDDSSHSSIVNTITDGLNRLSESFPWVAGQVVNEGASEGNSGIFKIKPLEKIPPLVVKDLRHDPSITMEGLRQADFPFSMLDERIVAPRNTLPGTSGEPIFETSPVFLLQATFITGGLLLTFLGHHCVMDMTGQGQIMYLLSKACRNEQFTKEELSSGNLPRRNLIPILDDSYEVGDELARQIVKCPSSHPASNDSDPSSEDDPTSSSSVSDPNCSWAYFAFSSSSLADLKSAAAKSVTLSSDSYISSDDVLTSFIWKSVTRARLTRMNPASVSTLARAVDVRRYLDIPQTYPGLMQNMTYNTYSLENIVKESLGVIASQLRLAVDPRKSNLGYLTRAYATVLERSPVKDTVSVTASIDISTDLMLSSWAKINSHELDFRLGLGRPEAVRRPQFVPVESLTYLMPKSLTGEIVVGICLRDEDLQRLSTDEEFVKYGRYIS